ncbi:MAG: hypothetical protein EA401_08345 [Planctomycetota bacterium]|nr:MAG: hypothetical protein EA401_08345 [Planctomycetota bacterium]
MAMIDAARAQQLLGCDDATFSNYINNGTLRSQRVDGQLMVEEADVEGILSAAGSDSSDSILVLDGESEDLSIDLGDEDGDDAAATIFDGGSAGTQHGTDQITFGDDLEVSFDDTGSGELDFGDGEQTVSFDDDDGEDTMSFDDSEATVMFDDSANTEQLSFTESNTAVLTDVDDTMMSTGTADYQTVDEGEYEDDDDDRPATGRSSVRRSVRAERVRQPAVRVSPLWIIILILTLIVSGAVIAPYYAIAVWPKENVYHYNGDRAYGLEDSGWANLAAALVGFDVEPHPATWNRLHPGAQDPHRPLSEADPEQPNVWRYQQYRGSYEETGQRANHFMITSVDQEETADGGFRTTRAYTVDGTTRVAEFPVNRVSRSAGGVDLEAYEPEITAASYR